MIAYIIAGAILGFYAPDLIAMQSPHQVGVPMAASLLVAFSGGVAGHALFTLLNM